MHLARMRRIPLRKAHLDQLTNDCYGDDDDDDDDVVDVGSLSPSLNQLCCGLLLDCPVH